MDIKRILKLIREQTSSNIQSKSVPSNVIDAYKIGKEVAKKPGIPEFPKGMRYYTPPLRQAILKGFMRGSKNATKG